MSTEYTEFNELIQQLETQTSRHAAAPKISPEAAAANPLSVICQVWPVIRTVLNIALKLPFIPGKDAIRAAIKLIDGICPNR